MTQQVLPERLLLLLQMPVVLYCLQLLQVHLQERYLVLLRLGRNYRLLLLLLLSQDRAATPLLLLLLQSYCRAARPLLLLLKGMLTAVLSNAGAAHSKPPPPLLLLLLLLLFLLPVQRLLRQHQLPT
jgi:hypothetical protein